MVAGSTPALVTNLQALPKLRLAFLSPFDETPSHFPLLLCVSNDGNNLAESVPNSNK